MSPDILTPGVLLSASSIPRTSAITAPTPTAAVGAPHRAAIILLFVLLIVALVACTVFLIWEPPFTGTIEYDTIAPLGSAYWAMHIYLSGPSFAVTWLAFAIFVTFLARERNAIATLAASVAIGLGALVFALVTTAEALPFAYAADSAVFREDSGRDVFDALNSNLGLLAPPILGSQAVIAAGVLVVLIVALVTRMMPRWFSIAGVLTEDEFATKKAELLARL